jgi:hypothetical protein
VIDGLSTGRGAFRGVTKSQSPLSQTPVSVRGYGYPICAILACLTGFDAAIHV